jgi:hypothetical protein
MVTDDNDDVVEEDMIKLWNCLLDWYLGSSGFFW